MRRIHPTVRRLNTEWHELAPAGIPAGWRAEPALAGARNLAGVLASVRADPDLVLGALLRSADPLAYRLVLQAMLGRVVLDAARDPLHELDDYIAELWLGIACYPLARRPARIAANLALDARKRVRGRHPLPLIDPSRFGSWAHLVESTPNAQLVLARARRIALIDDDAEQALRLVYLEGLRTTRAAAVLGVTPAALRQRCHRALRRLAAHAADLREPAA